MGRYRITGPGGEEFEVDGPDNASQADLEGLARQVAGVGGNYPVDSSGVVRGVQASNKANGAAGYSELLNQGITFGLSDELAGLVNAGLHPLTSGAYEQGRDIERQRIADARKNTGWGGTAAELLGGLVTGGTSVAGGQALLSTGRAALNAAKLGSVAGGISGFGSGNGTEDSLIRAAGGAALGGAVGALLPPVTQLIGNRISGLQRLIGAGNSDLPQQLVGEAIRADANTAAGVGRRLTEAAERGTPLAIADTGDNARGLLASVTRRPGPGRQATRALVDQRQTEQSGRVIDAVEQNLGRVGNIRQESDALMQQARTAAAPLYDEAYAAPVISTPELDSLLNTPAGRGALGRARTIAANERRDPQALGFQLDADGNVRLDPTLHINEDGSISQEPAMARGYTQQTLDYVKRGLDDIIEQYRDPVTQRLTLDEAGRAVNGVRAQLLNENDRLNPVYQQARQAYAGPASAEEALQLGRRSLNSSAEDIEAATARMSDAEREQYALGFRGAMADNINRAVDGAGQAQRLLGTPRKRQALEAVFGGEENFNRFLQTLADERATTETYRSVMTGSQTAERLAADAQTSDNGLLESAAGATLRGVTQPVGFLGDLIKSLGEVNRFGAGQAGDATRERVAALLSETDPQVLRNLAREIRTAAARQQLRRRGVNRVVGKAGVAIGSTVGGAPSRAFPSQ